MVNGRLLYDQEHLTRSRSWPCWPVSKSPCIEDAQRRRPPSPRCSTIFGPERRLHVSLAHLHVGPGGSPHSYRVRGVVERRSDAAGVPRRSPLNANALTSFWLDDPRRAGVRGGRSTIHVCPTSCARQGTGRLAGGGVDAAAAQRRWQAFHDHVARGAGADRPSASLFPRISQGHRLGGRQLGARCWPARPHPTRQPSGGRGASALRQTSTLANASDRLRPSAPPGEGTRTRAQRTTGVAVGARPGGRPTTGRARRRGASRSARAAGADDRSFSGPWRCR